MTKNTPNNTVEKMNSTLEHCMSEELVVIELPIDLAAAVEAAAKKAGVSAEMWLVDSARAALTHCRMKSRPRWQPTADEAARLNATR